MILSKAPRLTLLACAAALCVMASATQAAAPETTKVEATQGSPLKGQTVKIGILTDISGGFGDLGGQGSVEAAKMAVADFIKANHPDFKIEVISADHQNKAEVATEIANRWFKNDGVSVIGGLTNSSAALGVSEAASKLDDGKGKVILATGPGSDKLTNEACKPNTIHYGYDTYALSKTVVTEMMKKGKKSFYILQADYAFGDALANEAKKIIDAKGGKVVGSAKHAPDEKDFSSAMLAAKDSGADVVLLASAGSTMQNASKAAGEFELTKKQTVVGMLTDVTDVKAMGLKSAQGLTFAAGFNPNRTPESKEWDKRFFAIHKKPATMLQASDYSSVMHYLQAVQKTGSLESAKVVAAMKAAPVKDILTAHGVIRADGLLERDMYVAEVKKPSESKDDWDLLIIKSTIPGSEAYAPLSASRCPAVMNKGVKEDAKEEVKK